MKHIITDTTGAEPVTLAEAREAAGEYHTDAATSARLESLITAARQDAEDFLGSSLVRCTVKAACDFVPPSRLKLPRPPLSTVTSITMYDTAGTAYDVTGQYLPDTMGGGLALKETASLPGIELQEANCWICIYTSGPEDGTCPEKIKQALKLWIMAHYDAVPDSEWRQAFERLLWPWREVPI